MHTAGWTGLLYLLCTTRFAACEVKQLDRCHYLASFPVDGEVDLPCDARLMLQYVPEAVIRWYKDENEVLDVPGRVSLDQQGNLNLQKLQADDSGVYACHVGFPGGAEVIWSEVVLSVGGNVAVESMLQVKGTLGSTRNMFIASAASCIIVTLGWGYIICHVCTGK
ncbi:vascular endothelial growth factor receptor 1-like [Branchiostoma floridae]|nr:vascular endothelial growth factor receptor 1-like [Branchiostoma floridae]